MIFRIFRVEQPASQYNFRTFPSLWNDALCLYVVNPCSYPLLPAITNLLSSSRDLLFSVALLIIMISYVNFYIGLILLSIFLRFIHVLASRCFLFHRMIYTILYVLLPDHEHLNWFHCFINNAAVRIPK